MSHSGRLKKIVLYTVKKFLLMKCRTEVNDVPIGLSRSPISFGNSCLPYYTDPFDPTCTDFVKFNNIYYSLCDPHKYPDLDIF